jgi:hypothetical protein
MYWNKIICTFLHTKNYVWISRTIFYHRKQSKIVFSTRFLPPGTRTLPLVAVSFYFSNPITVLSSDVYGFLWLLMLSSDYLNYTLKACVILLLLMLSSDCLCDPLTSYVIFWLHTISSDYLNYTLKTCVILWFADSILWLPILSSDCLCYPLSAYVILWLFILSYDGLCYPLTSYFILWLTVSFSWTV